MVEGHPLIRAGALDLERGLALIAVDARRDTAKAGKVLQTQTCVSSLSRPLPPNLPHKSESTSVKGKRTYRLLKVCVAAELGVFGSKVLLALDRFPHARFTGKLSG